MKFATSATQVISAIENFGHDVPNNKALQARLSFARAWYAVKSQTGSWMFGPSKFIGYSDMNAAKYLATSDKGLDGRKTEAILQQWFTEIPTSEDLHHELKSALFDYLSQFGKVPSTKTRISIINCDLPDEMEKFNKIADLIIEVSKLLPASSLSRIKASI